jgi:hypothetical protein
VEADIILTQTRFTSTILSRPRNESREISEGDTIPPPLDAYAWFRHANAYENNA